MHKQWLRIASKRINFRRVAVMQRQGTGPAQARRGDRMLLLAALVVAATLPVSPAQAQITFSFTYTDPAGVGFSLTHPNGPARRTALEQTGTLLSSFLPSYTATINLSVNGAETNDSTLAAAGSNFNSAAAMVCTAGYNRGDVGLIALGGADPAPGTADGTVTVNFEDHTWDLDDSISPGEFDFKSTMLHELLHAMGFSHSVTQAGADPCGTTAPAAGGWVPYDQHLGNTSANFINGSFVIDTTAWTAAVTGGTGTAGVLWRGANGVAGNGGNNVPLFSPTTFSGGSSIAHLDDDFFTGTELLMEAATGTGPGVRTLSAIEVGIMQDIGFTNTVPVELQSFAIE